MDGFFKNIRRRWSPIVGSEISLHWHESSNFGDVLSRYITERLSARQVLSVNQDSPYVHYMVLGSILSLANEKSIVWGAGIANRSDVYIAKPHEIFMVRGRYSRDMCQRLGYKGDMTLGDPGYIISKLYQPSIKKSYKLGIIPHWVDYQLAQEMFAGRDDVLIMNLLDANVEAVIDKILSCERCISSSLHGLVVAHSYGIPCLQVTFSDDVLRTGLKKFHIGGDGVKYHDYFSSVGIPEYSPKNLSRGDQLGEVCASISDNCGDFDQMARILNCCPFVEKAAI